MGFVAPFETPVDAEGFFLMPFNQKETGLAMRVSLRCIENKGEPPFYVSKTIETQDTTVTG